MRLRDFVPAWVKAALTKNIVLVERSKTPYLTGNLELESLEMRGWTVLGDLASYFVVVAPRSPAEGQPLSARVSVLDLAFSHRGKIRSSSATSLYALICAEHGEETRFISLSKL